VSVYYSGEGVTLHLGDCLEVLPTLADACVDAVICDPPYGLADHHPRVIAETLAAWLAGDRCHIPAGKGFMGQEWDRFVPPPAVWDECLRVLKPGGHLAAFAAPRTADLMTLSIRLAGFEIRDSLMWVTAQGMPKGQNIGKAIDRHRDDRDGVLEVTAWLNAARTDAGLTCKQVDDVFGFNGMAGHWTTLTGKAAIVPTLDQWARLRDLLGFDDAGILPLVEALNGRKGDLGEAWARREVVGHRHSGASHGNASVFLAGATVYEDDMVPVTAPASDAARQWHGWNTQLRPAYEPIILARKSTGFNTTVANVLEHGTGAINVDACRTASAGPDITSRANKGGYMGYGGGTPQFSGWTGETGRWPANLLLCHGEECVDGGDCRQGCPVAELDAQGGVRSSGANPSRRSSSKFGSLYGDFEGEAQCAPARGADSGGTSRFFPVFRFEPKASAAERPRLADGTTHPTTKPVAVMSWIARLICPPGGLVLDPFAGSGTTLEAALAEGFRAVGVEREPQYAELCVRRLSRPIEPALFGLDSDGGAL
jgi:hypothetical protein